MINSRLLLFAALFSLACIIGCSGNSSNTTVPTVETMNTVGSNGHTSCLGLWQVVIDKYTEKVDVVDMRSSDLILNVLGFLEPPALSGMTINFTTLHIDADNKVVNVDVVLKHPINDPVFMGFDVRGVVFGPEVTNADGLTRIPSPEFFAGVPFGYKDGFLGTPDSVADYEGLAGYKYFCDGLGLNDGLADFMSNPANLAKRGVFSNGTTHTRHYDLSWANTSPPINFFVFNYAIYANYNWPTGAPPIDINDFDIMTANSQEAFCVKVTEVANSLWYSGGTGGGEISLDVEAWDWQGNIATVLLESIGPGLGAKAYDMFVGPGTTDCSYIYRWIDTPANPPASGNWDLRIIVRDTKTFGESWFMGLLPETNSKYTWQVDNYFLYTTTVIECAPPVITSINPNKMKLYPDPVYDDVTIAGQYFSGSGGITEIYLTDGTTQIDGTDINVISDTQATCDFDLTAFTGNPGTYDVVVKTACSGQGDGLVTITNNILFKQDFADGDGGCTNITGSEGYQYCSSTGRWEEYYCDTGPPYWPDNPWACYCGFFLTPAFNVPSDATDVHFRLRHSLDVYAFAPYAYYAGAVAGWTLDDGSTFYGDINDGENYWKWEEGQKYNCGDNYYAPIDSGCVGYFGSSYGWTERAWADSFGTLGEGDWSQFHCGTGTNLIGVNNVKYEIVFMARSNWNGNRGHEIYELIVWYDPA